MATLDDFLDPSPEQTFDEADEARTVHAAERLLRSNPPTAEQLAKLRRRGITAVPSNRREAGLWLSKLRFQVSRHHPGRRS